MPHFPKNVVVLGLVSFFNDFASEMIYPLVPIFLTATLGTPIEIFGLIEGIAESTASLTKYFFGAVADYFRTRKIFVIGGYGAGAMAKGLIGLATSWPLVLGTRFLDRVGKGLRTAPRDSLLLENATPKNKGLIFGFHRAFDSLGAVVGPLVALVLLNYFHDNLRQVFLFAVIPSLFGVALLIFFVHEKQQEKTNAPKKFVRLRWREFSAPLKVFLLASFVFALGNSADSFLILRASNLGLGLTLTVLAYATYNLSQTILSTPAGHLADRIGAKKVFAAGLLIFAIVYFFFGFIENPAWLWLLFPIYGIYIAFTDGVSKSYLAEFIAKEESGSYFGLYQMLTALGNFAASLIGGVLWAQLFPAATFWYGSALALLALLIFGLGSQTKIFTRTEKITA